MGIILVYLPLPHSTLNQSPYPSSSMYLNPFHLSPTSQSLPFLPTPFNLHTNQELFQDPKKSHAHPVIEHLKSSYECSAMLLSSSLLGASCSVVTLALHQPGLQPFLPLSHFPHGQMRELGQTPSPSFQKLLARSSEKSSDFLLAT